MTVSKKIITAGVITALSVSCLTPLIASAKTTESESNIPIVTLTKTIQDVDSEDGTENVITINSTDINLDREFSLDGIDDIIYEGATIPDGMDFKIDYGDLTEEEIKELEAIYNRYEEIFEKICSDTDTDLSDEEFDKRLAEYEDELEKLDKRAAELEEKAGWLTELDAFEDAFENLDGDEFFNDLLKDLDIDPEADIDDISADQVIGIVENVIDKIDSDDICQLFNGMDTNAANEVITEMKKIVKSDEFKGIVNGIIDAVSAFDDEF